MPPQSHLNTHSTSISVVVRFVKQRLWDSTNQWQGLANEMEWQNEVPSRIVVVVRAPAAVAVVVRGGGGDDRRNYRKPLPEDAYTNWMEDELARIIKRILERADARFLANMPPYPDGSINTLNTNKWMNWLHHLLDGHLERHCGINYNDKSLVNDLYDECVKSSAWLDVMNILELVAKVVRKVRGNTANDCSDSGDPEYYT